MKRARLVTLILLLSCTLASAAAQEPDWNLGGAEEVTTSLTTLPAVDQQGIERALAEPADNLLAMRIKTSSGNIFLVQGLGNDCGASGNCTSWVLSSDYKILLKTIAQMFKVESSLHADLPDILTTTHGSAYAGDLQQWQFNGTLYRRVACATYSYQDSFGDTLRKPRITTRSCPRH